LLKERVRDLENASGLGQIKNGDNKTLTNDANIRLKLMEEA